MLGKDYENENNIRKIFFKSRVKYTAALTFTTCISKM